MWVLIITGDFTKHELSDEQRDYYVESCKRGQEMVELSDGRVLSNKINSLTRVDNEILNDPLYVQYKQLGSGDADVRRKMQIERYLNSRYPYEKNIHDWNEVNGVKDNSIVISEAEIDS